MYINNEEYTIAINHPTYLSYSNKVGGMCVGIDLLEWFKQKVVGVKTYLEIGTFDGIMLSILAENNPNTEFYVIDAFSAGVNTGGGHFEYFIENNKRLKNVHLYKGYSTEMLPLLKDIKFDIAFIDGDHSYEVTKSDFTSIYNLMNPNGIIAMHDIDMSGVIRAMKECSEELGVSFNKENFLAWCKV